MKSARRLTGLKNHSRVFVFASAIAWGTLLNGCGDSDDGGGGDGDGDGSGGATGNPGDGDGCIRGDSEAALFPWQNLEDSLIYRMGVDESHVYFSTVDRIYRVPIDGGEPEELWAPELAVTVPFWVRDDHLLVYHASHLHSLPKSGGDPVELGRLDPGPQISLVGSIAFEVVGDVAFGKSEDDDFSGDEVVTTVTYFQVDLSDASQTTLSTIEALGDGRPIGANETGIYFADAAASGTFQTIYRVDAEGGDPAEIPLDYEVDGLSVLGASEDHVFLLDTSNLSSAKVLSLPAEGGEPTDLFEGSALLAPVVHHALDPNGLSYVLALDTAYGISEDGQDASELFCVQQDAHAFAVSETHAFVAIYDGTDSTIVKIPLD